MLNEFIKSCFPLFSLACLITCAFDFSYFFFISSSLSFFFFSLSCLPYSLLPLSPHFYICFLQKKTTLVVDHSPVCLIFTYEGSVNHESWTSDDSWFSISILAPVTSPSLPKSSFWSCKHHLLNINGDWLLHLEYNLNLNSLPSRRCVL